MVIFPLAPDQTIAQMWSNGARGGFSMEGVEAPLREVGYGKGCPLFTGERSGEGDVSPLRKIF